ncbi:adhesion G protein-coupled receptor E5 [Dasypus novemcinctus]|uniref:adhesion G protein-coupled receptor E5 n=1 Tax=Dasypus novemcinctus TaxID=9361 RepID=UPI00265FB42E|nr:adhesion G protein-coupled receptor E5 [Dasypus novemcinctus]
MSGPRAGGVKAGCTPQPPSGRASQCECVCACVCVRVCVSGAHARRSRVPFPPSFQLPRQFRGGPWALPPPRHPCIKTGPPGRAPSCRGAATRDGPGRSTSPAAARPWEAHGAPALLALGLLLILSEGGCQKPTAPCAPWCSQHSTCVSATACRCHPGFTSLSGEISSSFDEPCEDINECAPPMTVSCGKLAQCRNLEGSYECECSAGYVLPSGGKTFRNESENRCQDLDECRQDPRICRGRSLCINTQGSYTCQCLPGFRRDPGDPSLCTDVNECTSGRNPCHSSTHCLNKVGGYQCRCRPGWKPAPGSPNGPNTTVCEDEDECSAGKHRCHESTYCVNTVGAYVCRCRRGWVPKPGYLNNQNTTVCTVSIPPWAPPPGSSSQALSRFFGKIQDLCREFKPATAQSTIQNLVNFVDELLDVAGDLEALNVSDRYRLATQLLSGLEEILRTMAETLSEGPLTYLSPGNTELSLMVQEKAAGDVTVGQSHARMQLNWDVAARGKESGPTVVGFLSCKKMEKLLANASLELGPAQKAELAEVYQSPVNSARLRLLSAVSSVFLSNDDTQNLSSPVNFSFSHRTEKPGPRQELLCAFWKGSGDNGGQWATTGCRRLGGQDGYSVCQCDHLSSFAVLMAHYDVQDPQLALITKVGLGLSLVCLLLCILTFLLVRPIQGSRTTVHLHLCICLFVGSAVFLAGIENQGGQVGLRCRLVAGLLHYCFLAAFCWMSLEGLELYFLVVRVFRGQGLGLPWLYLIGYGVPGLIVAVSAAVRPRGYGRDIYCWLDPEHGFLWSFLGPVTVILLGNAVIFVTTVWRLTQKFSEINPDMKKLKKARVLTVTAVAQLCVLGCTWVFGLFLFDPHNRVLSYTFTALNCLQGLFLFLLHCLLNKKVREEYRKWACLVAGSKYSEFASSTSGSSQQQTRALRPSESGM